MTTTLTNPDAEVKGHVNYGSAAIAEEGQILRTVVGSGVHGIEIAGTDDHDEMGVYIEPARYVFGLATWNYELNREDHSEGKTPGGMPHFNYRTQPDGHRSNPGDVDRIMYSLRKYVRMAAVGNPTALLPLFAPEKDVLFQNFAGRTLRGHASIFISQRAVVRFLGYMNEQHRRMLGESKRNVPNRPELVEKFGFDVKYASHALRLAYQGNEVARTGHLTLPLPPEQREHVLAVKQGQYTKLHVSQEIQKLVEDTEKLQETNPAGLTKQPDWDQISQLVMTLHQMHWNMVRVAQT